MTFIYYYQHVNLRGKTTAAVAASPRAGMPRRRFWRRSP
jgi:hypothetical protein